MRSADAIRAWPPGLIDRPLKQPADIRAARHLYVALHNTHGSLAFSCLPQRHGADYLRCIATGEKGNDNVQQVSDEGN
jgi:hypothetical protein